MSSGVWIQQPLIKWTALPGNPNAIEPIPVSALMNDQEQPTFPVEANKTYYLRIINMSGFAQFYLHIDGHNMTIIEADGVYSVAQPVEDLYIATGKRYGVLLKTKPTTDRNFAILGAMDLKGFPGSAPPPPHPNVTGALIYNRMAHHISHDMHQNFAYTFRSSPIPFNAVRGKFYDVWWLLPGSFWPDASTRTTRSTNRSQLEYILPASPRERAKSVKDYLLFSPSFSPLFLPLSISRKLMLSADWDTVADLIISPSYHRRSHLYTLLCQVSSMLWILCQLPLPF